jgi:hypothetical protein
MKIYVAQRLAKSFHSASAFEKISLECMYIPIFVIRTLGKTKTIKMDFDFN